MRALFIGFGNVGKMIAEILFIEKDKYPNLALNNLTITGIFTRTRGALAVNNTRIRNAAVYIEAGMGKILSFWFWFPPVGMAYQQDSMCCGLKGYKYVYD